MSEARQVGLMFSSEMVRALLAGRKHETRRLLDVPDPDDARLLEIRSSKRATLGLFQIPGESKPVRVAYRLRADDIVCVQENWRTLAIYDENKGRELAELLARFADPLAFPRRYVADCSSILWPSSDGRPMPSGLNRPPKTLPKILARISRRVRAVRFERLLQIDERSAIAEGVIRTEFPDRPAVFHFDDWPTSDCCESAVEMFKLVWDRMHGKKRPFEMNPWVAVVELESTS